MPYPIADLHCDLLSYLEHPQRTPYDAHIGCSIPFLREGGVRTQTMAVYTQTEADSVKKGMAQVGIYKNLPALYPNDIDFFEINSSKNRNPNKVGIVLAFENASSFVYEDEPLFFGLKRLEHVITAVSKPIYISLTWNMENRFGGGATTNIGLKDDGKRLIEYLHQKKIAVDFSHTSDRLAFDILNFIDREKLEVPILASHSNARAVTSVPRNLPDDIAREIFLRNGIIGINFYKKFVGPEAEKYFIMHLAHWIEMKGISQICFGADFFYDAKAKDSENFYLDYSNALGYQKLIDIIKKALGLDAKAIEGLASGNFLAFCVQNLL